MKLPVNMLQGSQAVHSVVILGMLQSLWMLAAVKNNPPPPRLPEPEPSEFERLQQEAARYGLRLVPSQKQEG